MNCACHGEPCYWQKDKRGKHGGYWECSVKRAAYNRARTTDPAKWAARRRRDLAAQRADVLERLKQLDREATEC